MSEASDLNTKRSKWPIHASHAAAFGMIVCFAVLFIQLLFWLSPSLDTRGMVFVCALAVLEAFFSFWLIKRLPTAQNQPAYYRVTEVLILLVTLKFFTELRAGPANFWNNFLLWPVDFPFNLLNARFFLTAAPVMAAWWVGNLFATDLTLLGMEDTSILDDRRKAVPIRTLILRRFLSLGVLVIILAAIPSQSILNIPLPVVSNGTPIVVAFFVLGIILLSLTRYITLETNWWQAQLHIPVQIPRRWFAYSALILAILVLLISWLPTNYGLGLFATLNAVYQLITQSLNAFYALVLLVIALFIRLAGKAPAEPDAPVSQFTPPTGQLPLTPANGFNWQLVQSVLMWGGLIVLVFMALRQYIAFNRDLAEELRRFRPLAWLVTAWERLMASFKKANKSVGEFIQNSIKRLRSAGADPAKTGEWDFINPRRLPARQKVIFYYLALVRRAKEAGLPRQENQTPYEYARSLTSNLQEGKDGVDAMTESFIEARYSRHDIPAAEARQAESIWEAIRRILRNVRKSRPE